MRSRLAVSLTVLLCNLLLASCSASPSLAPNPQPATPATTAQAPLPAPSPTSAPAADLSVLAPTNVPSAALPEDDLARVKTTGVLQVGTALDNPPFTGLDEQKRPTGLDIALITELARRLGLRVQINNVSYHNLVRVLQEKEADVAIAAIGVTPDRAKEVDFTNVYYVGQDGILAARNSSTPGVRTLDDLIRLRVGVQRGSVYETWLKENVVQTGKMPAHNLKLYATPELGIQALTAGSIDAFVLDRQPALELERQGKARYIGENLYPQVYGIAVRKGSTLLPELNRVLAEVQGDGTMTKLVETYLDLRPGVELPATREPFPTEAATATPSS